MKFCSLIIASFCVSASAFSAVAPKSTAPNLDPVDKTMVDVDANDFDPTEGENPAVKLNNNDEVWVDQVSSVIIYH